jgi:soluble lytic murein transglycosylase-like protein
MVSWIFSLVRSASGHGAGRRWSLAAAGSLIPALLVLTAAVYAETAPAAGAVSAAPVGVATDVDAALERAGAAARAWTEVERHYEREVAPIERVLRQYRDDPALVQRIAVSLVREARRVDMEPRLLLAVLLVENPQLRTEARSSVGARGLMQVMPLHKGNWPPCEPDLVAVESNICHGARIFAHYYRVTGGDVERALLRYNGCVRGTNTPDCHRYPYHVYARAGRASILAWLQPAGAAAP